MKANQLKTVFKIFSVGALFTLFLACDQGYNERVTAESVDISERYNAIEEDDNAFSAPENAKTEVPQDLKIIKSANVRYKVKRVKAATKKIQQMAQGFRAYVSDQRFENTNYKIENRFTVKVPQQHFNAMMDSIGGIAEFVDYENITTEDVTEEFIDIETRLKTKQEVKQRYEAILRKNAKTVEDILRTEEKLRIIQEEIESAQGRLKYLTSKVSYSTIQIDLYETVSYTEKPERYSRTFFSKAKDGLTFGWAIVETFILGIIHIWPLIAIALLLLLFFMRKRLKIRKK